MGDMQGKIVIVTGATGGIGSAVVSRFTEAGATIAITDHQSKHVRVKELFNELRIRGGVSTIFTGDVTCQKEVIRQANTIKEFHGKIDVLVNAAGVMWSAGVLAKTPIEKFADLRTMFDINFWGTVYWCHAVLPLMRDIGFGRIINISSIMYDCADPGNWAYGASKAAVALFTKTLAQEAPFHKNGPLDITVNAVAPGITDTDMTKAVPEKYWARYIERVPSQRKGTPEEIADAVYFLANNAYMNGEILHVDGGYSAM